jgi:hypothetical protein
MVRKWSEFRTNSEQLLSVFSKVESVELLCCSDVEVLVCKAVKKCSSVGGRKKSAWTDLDQVNFEKNLQCPNVQIEKPAWTGLGKNKKASSAASVFKFLQDWSPGGRRMRSALRWPALDKRCSSCYTLRGCGFADIQSREEFTDALAS